MKCARLRTLTKGIVDGVVNSGHILKKYWIVVGAPVSRVLTAIAEVEHDDLMIIEKLLPVRKIPVDRASVAVAHDQAGSGCPAISSQDDFRTVVQKNGVGDVR